MKYVVFLKSLLIVAGILSISACHQRKTVNYLLLHPEKIQPLYEKCVALDGTLNANQASECGNIMAVLPTFRALLDELVNDPNQFALDIMHAEIKLVSLQKSYRLAVKAGEAGTINRLKREIDELKVAIQIRLALMRLVSKNE
jgi:hypothetical protein